MGVRLCYLRIGGRYRVCLLHVIRGVEGVFLKIPIRVRVAGHWIETVYRDEIEPLEEGSFSPMGLALFGSNTIVIAKRHFNSPISESNKAEAWIHELIHHIDEKYDVGLSEKNVRRLAAGLHQVLTENKISFGAV
jgi:hypothetical protein